MTAPGGAAVSAAARVRVLIVRGRRPVLGLASQLLNAGTNVVTAYVASLLLVPAEFGAFVIAFSAVSIVIAIGRGLVGATMTVHLPAQADDDRAPLVDSAFGYTALAGLGATGLLLLAGFVHPVMWWLAPWVIVALLHDVGRYVFFAAGRSGSALALDVAWAAVQGAVLGIGWLALGSVTLPLVACAWGLGALGGLLLFGFLHRFRPAHPRLWSRATRDVAGWFTAVAVVGQVEIYLVLVLTGLLLAASDVGGVRAVQLLAYQPAMVLLAALLTVMQPDVVRARHSAAGLRRACVRAVVLASPVIGGLVLLAMLRVPLMRLLFPHYVGYAPLVVPIALQCTFVALSLGPLCVLNGLRQGSSVFRTQVVRTSALVAAAVVGMRVAGVAGLAWALASASSLVWLQLLVVTHRAIVRAVPAEPRDEEPATAAA